MPAAECYLQTVTRSVSRGPVSAIWARVTLGLRLRYWAAVWRMILVGATPMFAGAPSTATLSACVGRRGVVEAGMSHEGSPIPATQQPSSDSGAAGQKPWKTWWVWLFGVVAVGLLLAVCFAAPFELWAPIALVTFGTMEGYGLSSTNDAYPPLTQITRKWCPRWFTFLLIFGFVGLAGGTWFHFQRRWWLAALGALLGWLTAHFDVTYDAPAVKRQNAQYQRYAQKLHLRRFQQRLAENQRRRDVYGAP